MVEQRSAWENYTPIGNKGSKASILRDTISPLLQPVVNELFHRYNKSFHEYRTSNRYELQATSKILKEFFPGGEKNLTLEQLGELNQSILRNYGSLWNIADEEALLKAIKPYSLTRTLCLFVCRYREIRKNGENLHGLVARVAGASRVTTNEVTKETTTSTIDGDRATTSGAAAGASASAAGAAATAPLPPTVQTDSNASANSTRLLGGTTVLQPFEDDPDPPTKSYEDDQGHSFLSGGLL
jgi:hypothetical protein